ncbi:putative membrane protein (plasmid) [Rhodococcus opacus]|uniref:Putative membrane protein n=1 Tax=Rhodococcus opacus TaxID=37919 RepID=A0A1B1KH63_RHOOP|nr:putative membrane protein [Rhodococcus opacus]
MKSTLLSTLVTPLAVFLDYVMASLRAFGFDLSGEVPNDTGVRRQTKAVI